MTLKQECFRARLTPKPWRCGSQRPPNQYPWQDQKGEARYRDWQRRYEQAAEAYRVCDLVETCGTPTPSAEITAVLALHDELACNPTDRELA